VNRRGLAYGLLFLLSPILVTQACGPDFAPDVFVPAHRPMVPKNFAKGELGVLQPGYFIAEKVVAFRYMNGGTLNEDEQRQLVPVAAPGIDYEHMTDEEANAAQQAEKSSPAQDRWNSARHAYGPGGGAAQDRPMPFAATPSAWTARIVNCGDSAFNTAADTLTDRTAKWGKDSAELKDWVAAQDAVFSHCNGDGGMPAAAAANAPLLLKQDRAYQNAAAIFYSGDYTAARDAFLAIAKDKASPWSRWGLYLAARSTVRQAAKTIEAKDDFSQAQFDTAGLQTAKQMLLEAAGSNDPHVKHAAQAELNFVMIRLDPTTQASTLAKQLAGPGHDTDFGQHLVDLRFLLDHGTSADAPLLRWMTLSGSPVAYSMPSAAGTPHVVPSAETEWHQHADLPHLVAALMNAKSGSSTLMQAAAAVPENSPAYITVQFHRARLLAAANDLQSSREITSHALEITRKRDEVAATNALLEVRMKTAPDFNSLLQDAPRTMISPQSQSAAEAGCADLDGTNCKIKIPVLQMNEDSARLFNTHLPLALWIDAAANEALPKHLRDTVALSAWLRALMLQRTTEAKALTPLLPARVQDSLAKSDDPTGYAATLVLLHSPGLRPFLDAGVQRAVTYSETDSYRNNLWCSTMEKAIPQMEGTNAPMLPTSDPAFLTPEQRQQARTEVAALDAHPVGVEWLGRRTIDYVKDHPEEPVAAESLALVVKLTRYACFVPNEGGKSSASSTISKEAFNLLHNRYPKSEWAVKTKYYY
jgi:hypothetical protein